MTSVDFFAVDTNGNAIVFIYYYNNIQSPMCNEFYAFS